MENGLVWLYHNVPQHRTKLRQIDRFGAKNQIKSSDFNGRILTFSRKYKNKFSLVWMFGDMFPQSHRFVTMPVTIHIKYTCSNLSPSNN